MNITVHTDGASRGNPGAASIAYVIDGLPEGRVEYKESIGTFSNNQAEYRALVAALERLIEEGVSDSEINFYSDSELMVKQINGEYRVKDNNLRPLFEQITADCTKLENLHNQIQFTAIRREFNKIADHLANVALDGE